ncbi:hypothetical protein U1707_01305 [Sphingomonas sp. PB2P12]|uniref:hypothetical protein n=1 Tax=Sphingomonas sandaracina TaxID=3096157 RepID=UPI002FCAC350
MPHASWTVDADRELARQYMSGRDVEDIATGFGRTVSAVRTRVGTLGLQRRKTAALCNRPASAW